MVLLAAGVTVRLDRVQVWTSTEVLSAVAVKVCVPSLSVAPTGILLTVMAETVSAPSVIEALIDSGMAVSSAPAAVAVTLSTGASGDTVTAIDCAAEVVDSPSASLAVAVTERLKSVVLLAAGVTVRLDRVQVWTSTEVLSAVAVKVCVPSLSVAPTGILLTVMAETVSAPSVIEALIDSGMAVSSAPAAVAVTLSTGASGDTVTAIDCAAEVVDSPSASLAVAVTERLKSVVLLAAGVTVRLDRVQ